MNETFPKIKTSNYRSKYKINPKVRQILRKKLLKIKDKEKLLRAIRINTYNIHRHKDKYYNTLQVRNYEHQ
jgi:hypothetical protein